MNWTGDNSTTRHDFGNVQLSWPKAPLDGEKIVNFSQLRYSHLPRHHTVRTWCGNATILPRSHRPPRPVSSVSVLVRTADGAGNGALCVRGGDCRRHQRRCPVRPPSVLVRTADGAGNGALCVRGGDCRRHRQRCSVRPDLLFVKTVAGAGNCALCFCGEDCRRFALWVRAFPCLPCESRPTACAPCN